MEDVPEIEEESGMSTAMKLLIVGTVLIAVIAGGYIIFSSLGSDADKAESVPSVGKNEEKEIIDRENLILSFGYADGSDAVLLVINNGEEAITTIDFKVGGYPKEYEIVSGILPLEPGRDLYVKVKDACDGKVHYMETTDGKNKAEFLLTNECSDIQ